MITNSAVVIIDYKMGNVASVEKAFSKIGAKVIISNKKKDIKNATHIVLPGVGAFGEGIKNLKELDIAGVLDERVRKDNVPFLGICLGMQLLAETGHEFGIHKGLGWVRGDAIKLEINKGLRLPHMGWNEIKAEHNDILFEDVPDNNFYFLHSYHLNCADASIVSSICEYGQSFTASIHKNNIFATQFHPEKSQVSGMQVLKNFLHYSHHA